MAQCYKCERQIPYLAMVRGIFRHFGRNFRRRVLVVFNCPHCGTECQEAALTAYGFVALVFPVAFAMFAIADRWRVPLKNETLAVVILLIVLVLHGQWWRYLSVMKTPHRFPWE